MKKGIDVSQWQGDINWGAVNADFAILRAGYGRVKSQIDTKFEQNYRNAKAVGMPLGAYWYSYAMSADEAREEAKVFLEIIKGKQFEYPVYFDVEENKALALGRDRVSDIIIAFLEEMEKAGYFAGLYMSASHLTSHDSVCKRQICYMGCSLRRKQNNLYRSVWNVAVFKHRSY